VRILTQFRAECNVLDAAGCARFLQTNIYMSRHGGYIEQICYHISYRIFYFRLHSINTTCVPYFILADGGSLSKQEIKLQAAFWDLYKAICQRLKSTNFYVAELDRGRGCQKGRQKSMQGRAGHWAGLERRSSAQTRAWRAAIQYGGKKIACRRSGGIRCPCARRRHKKTRT
jgi:hypothetical protein